MEQVFEQLTTVWTVVWPALAVAALRATDVTLTTVRTVLVVQSKRWAAAAVAGAEAGVWLSAAGIVFADTSPARVAGFVAGVAAGTAIGVSLIERLKVGSTTVRVYVPATQLDADGVTVVDGSRVADAIRRAGFAATVFTGQGRDGPVDMVLSTVSRRKAEAVLAAARTVDEDAFASFDSDPRPVLQTTTGRV